MSYLCKFCEKSYSSYSSRSNHVRIYHRHHTLPQCDQKLIKHEKNVTKCDQSKHDNVHMENTCKFCEKVLANRHSRWRHEKKCKTNRTDSIEILELRKEIEELKILLQKSMKIHPPDLLEKS
jgi:hypothetical protein